MSIEMIYDKEQSRKLDIKSNNKACDMDWFLSHEWKGIVGYIGLGEDAQVIVIMTFNSSKSMILCTLGW